jgi:hypothetical protein
MCQERSTSLFSEVEKQARRGKARRTDGVEIGRKGKPRESETGRVSVGRK